MVICNNGKTWPPVARTSLQAVCSSAVSTANLQRPVLLLCSLYAVCTGMATAAVPAAMTPTLLSMEASWASAPAQISKKQVAVHTGV